jgi:hypothetical protein
MIHRTETGGARALPSTKPKYRVNVGLNYPPNKRAEAGDVINDLPPGSEESLLKLGVIEVAK